MASPHAETSSLTSHYPYPQSPQSDTWAQANPSSSPWMSSTNPPLTCPATVSHAETSFLTSPYPHSPQSNTWTQANPSSSPQMSSTNPPLTHLSTVYKSYMTSGLIPQWPINLEYNAPSVSPLPPITVYDIMLAVWQNSSPNDVNLRHFLPFQCLVRSGHGHQQHIGGQATRCHLISLKSYRSSKRMPHTFPSSSSTLTTNTVIT